MFPRQLRNDERPGRPPPNTSTTDDYVEKVKKMIMNNRKITIGKVADYVGTSIDSCHAIFSDGLGMSLLNFETKTVPSKKCSRVTKRSKQRSITAMTYHNR